MHQIDYLLFELINGNNPLTKQLEKYETEKLNLLYNAFLKKKLFPNIILDDWNTYYPNGFITHDKHIIELIWTYNLGLNLLKQVLEAGFNLDLCINKYIPEKYNNLLLEYGKIGVGNKYNPNIWSGVDLNKQININLIDKVILDKFKLVCISDTHMEHEQVTLSTGDILICCGDVSTYNNKNYDSFLIWMSKTNFKYKILIAGNHDKWMEDDPIRIKQKCDENGIIYLQDNGISINGYKFWGSPWTPKRKKNRNDAFTLSRKDLLQKWDLIPKDTDILITHCPPYGIGDLNSNGYTSKMYQSGDYCLLKTIGRLSNLKLHLFGHCHYGRGMYEGQFNNNCEKKIYFINCAVVENKNCYSVN
jgi:Icc-related predicted phosphoesterase